LFLHRFLAPLIHCVVTTFAASFPSSRTAAAATFRSSEPANLIDTAINTEGVHIFGQRPETLRIQRCLQVTVPVVILN
jgi:hypothetical protein